MITSDQIKSIAQSLGFDACGIVSMDGRIGREDRERFSRWIDQGFHGEMKYLENFEERAKKFWGSFPEAKSIIVVGVNYYSGSFGDGPVGDSPRRDGSEAGESRSVPGRNVPRGRVARYAWGKDYHRVIGKQLEQFQEKLSEKSGREVRAEICVDTKPLHERSLAQRAGLGFIGKQSQLLSPKFGPWLFLAELVTDLELEGDPPFVGDCGSCTICIERCPTQAIRPEGGIDARRCIAYLTIEHKSEIPEPLKPLMGDWVFGCDLCLEVCPFTSKAKETAWPQFKPESGVGPRLDLLSLLQIPSNRAYRRVFEESAVLRANRKQLLRNAAVTLKNLESAGDDLKKKGNKKGAKTP